MLVFVVGEKDKREVKTTIQPPLYIPFSLSLSLSLSLPLSLSLSITFVLPNRHFFARLEEVWLGM